MVIGKFTKIATVSHFGRLWFFEVVHNYTNGKALVKSLHNGREMEFPFSTDFCIRLDGGMPRFHIPSLCFAILIA